MDDELKKIVTKILDDNRFKPKSKSWTDYEYAKICLDKNLPKDFNYGKWREVCFIIAEYLGV